MPLFDQIPRQETRPRRQNEGAFAYQNTSARRGIAAIRDMLESWFAHVPPAAQADIRGRFREDDEVQHQSSFFELFWHELLYASGYEIELHPDLPDASTNPDFLARRGGEPQFYFEATLAMPPGDLAAARRIAQLHDTLDRLESPDFFLDFEYRGTPQANLRGAVLRDRLARWLQQLDYNQLSALYEKRDYDAVPRFHWPEEGLLLTFSPIPKGPKLRGQPGVRPVGIAAPLDLRRLRTHEDIREAIEGKATKYGQLHVPLIIAVNVMEDLFDESDVWNALLGEEQLIATRQEDGRFMERLWRAPNGAWRGQRGARNTLASAVAVTHQLSPTALRTQNIEVILNPWAANPLAPEHLSLPRRIPKWPTAEVERREGRNAADILGIPELWPVPDPE